jgi:hypothetical protein
MGYRDEVFDPAHARSSRETGHNLSDVDSVAKYIYDTETGEIVRIPNYRRLSDQEAFNAKVSERLASGRYEIRERVSELKLDGTLFDGK